MNLPQPLKFAGLMLRSLPGRIVPQDKLRRAWLLNNAKAPFGERLAYEAFGRNDYAYGMYQAAVQAKALGIKRVTAVEFGVFNGDGLGEMEKIAWCMKQELDVKFDLFGFDTGEGLPPPTDIRDLGYVWRSGLFAPRRDLSTYLKKAKMVLGDVALTVPKFQEHTLRFPLAFISVDVDYYTSTVHCLKLLASQHDKLLPRVFVYLDDIVGGDEELHCKYAGELAAVEDFNSEHPQRKIAPIYGLRWKRKFPRQWNDQMFVAHIFDHPRYNEHKGSRWDKDQSPAFVEAKPATRPHVAVANASRD